MKIGDRVQDSPVGPGQITEFSCEGFPKVNDVPVPWLRLEDGYIFDPSRCLPRVLFAKVDELRKTNEQLANKLAGFTELYGDK